MKSKEELNEIKSAYETLNNKLKELSEDELGFVVGGSHHGVSDFISETEGDWFRLHGDSEFIYRLRKINLPILNPDRSTTSPAALLDRFWYNGSEAWYYGTVSEIVSGPEHAYYEEIPAPTIIHDECMYITKPY